MVGTCIKRLRQDKKITQNDLAKWLGVSRQAISMWEANKRELKASTLNKIAKVFGVTIDELLTLQNRSRTRKEGGRMWTKGEKNRVSFEISAPAAKCVALTGDFKGWDNKGIAMKRNKDGIWKVGVTLKPGRYEYKFIVDDNWLTDPANQTVIRNSLGSFNSVVELAK